MGQREKKQRTGAIDDGKGTILGEGEVRGVQEKMNLKRCEERKREKQTSPLQTPTSKGSPRIRALPGIEERESIKESMEA